MKFFVTLVVMVALLAALCSVQPVDSVAPGQPDTSINVRVKRQEVTDTICRCPENYTLLSGTCVTCDKYLDMTADDDCPVCGINGWTHIKAT